MTCTMPQPGVSATARAVGSSSEVEVELARTECRGSAHLKTGVSRYTRRLGQPMRPVLLLVLVLAGGAFALPGAAGSTPVRAAVDFSVQISGPQTVSIDPCCVPPKFRTRLRSTMSALRWTPAGRRANAIHDPAVGVHAQHGDRMVDRRGRRRLPDPGGPPRQVGAVVDRVGLHPDLHAGPHLRDDDRAGAASGKLGMGTVAVTLPTGESASATTEFVEPTQPPPPPPPPAPRRRRRRSLEPRRRRRGRSSRRSRSRARSRPSPLASRRRQRRLRSCSRGRPVVPSTRRASRSSRAIGGRPQPVRVGARPAEAAEDHQTKDGQIARRAHQAAEARPAQVQGPGDEGRRSHAHDDQDPPEQARLTVANLRAR